jgi:hypothetical protein
MVAASKKLDVIKAFDICAKEVTKTIRPVTNMVNIPLKNIPDGVVLKGEGSDMAKHMYLPWDLDNLSKKTLNSQLQ